MSCHSYVTCHVTRRVICHVSYNCPTYARTSRMLAYKAEDMHKRLKPDELMEREVLEQSIQDEVAAHCIHLWMKRYLKPVVDNFSMEADDQVTIMCLSRALHHRLNENVM